MQDRQDFGELGGTRHVSVRQLPRFGIDDSACLAELKLSKTTAGCGDCSLSQNKVRIGSSDRLAP
jgi:hypothetical protein